MFINKIDFATKPAFKGYQHVKNDVGETVIKFNYPYDYDKENCEVQFFKVIPTDKYNYKVIETPIAKVDLKPEGVNVNLQSLTNLNKDEAFAYKIIRRDKNSGKVIWEGSETGVKLKPNENGEFVFRVSEWEGPEAYKYNLVSRKATTPTVQGAGYLAMPDQFMPGAKFKGFNDINTGEIYYDKDYQKYTEGLIRNFSNVFGGNLAGVQLYLPALKKSGYKVLFLNPIANGDQMSSHSYWNENNMQIADRMGNAENYASFVRELFKNGMKYVNDDTFTSEGLNGIHFQYALRWAEKNPQTYYWFKMTSIKNRSLGLGTIPKNKENLAHRIINAPYNYEINSHGTYKKTANPNYNPNKETYVQIYDKRGQLKDYDNAVKNYESLKSGNELSINNHDDTLVNYIMAVNPKEYDNRVEEINKLIESGKKITLDSPEGTILACHFSNFRFDKKTEGGFVAWDANTDMVKKNYHISGYDEKINQAIVSDSARDYEKQMIERGAREVQDMAIQEAKYWTQKVKDIQTIYTAKTLGKNKTLEGIEKLIAAGKLPEEARINNNQLNNILNGQYIALSPKGIADRDSVTVKALMSLPLEALELGANTTGVLGTSYFTNRATTDETIGVSRFELMTSGNPHLVEPYRSNYEKVNTLYKNEIKNFADKIIKEVNKTSDEKLIDADGEYTEYGEYVMELMGQTIAKYAFLKALAGNKLNTKILNNGEITYDYETLKNETTLKALGIEAHSPQDEASMLLNKITKGLKKLSSADVSYVADSIKKQIYGTDTNSFRLAEALVDKSGLQLDHRIDAMKDVMDQDAVRNGDNDFDDVWNDNIKFWAKVVKGIKEVNPYSNIIAEITDIPDLMRDTTGYNVWPYDGATNIGQKFNGEPDAFVKLFNETGITTEAAYSYFFTDLLKVFACDFADGSRAQSYIDSYQYTPHDTFKNRMDLLLKTRSIDYLRNLYTFMGNHDKPRLIHGLALDMGLFYSSLLNDYGNNFEKNHSYRLDAIRVMSGAKTLADVPIELRLNADNNNYFITTSARAAAMNKLLMDVIDNDMKDKISAADRETLKKALIDLANGNYLGSGKTEDMSHIRLKELTDLYTAFDTILKMAENHGLKLSDTERKNLIEKVVSEANSMNFDKYFVKGDFDWKDIGEEYKKANLEALKEVLGTNTNSENYSLYTVQLARLLKDAYTSTGKTSSAVIEGIKDFVKKYDKNMVLANTSEFKKIEDTAAAVRKNAYAARDIKTAVKIAVKQAEYNGAKINHDIIDEIYIKATEPAVAKANMVMEYLKGLFGIPTMYSGDEFGLTGYEEKAKNIYLQNRNVNPFTELDGNGLISNYRKAITLNMNSSLGDRNNPNYSPLNNGTPYNMDVVAHSKDRNQVIERIKEINKELSNLSPKETSLKAKLENERTELTRDLAKIAYLMHSANGDMTITVFNAGYINNDSRHNYFEEYGLTTEQKRKKFFEENNISSINPNNPYVPIQPKSEMDALLLGAGIAIPVGTIFTNANARDKAEYVVKEIKGKLGIVRKDGGKIIMDGISSKNGVMVLKCIKKLAFKGAKPYNTYGGIGTSVYNREIAPEAGKRLSVVSK